MHFGDTVREILTASCGQDLRAASAATAIPLDVPGTTRALAANLELAFGIAIPEHDFRHLRTVRDVLQCVRLRLWERRVQLAPAAPPAARGGRPVFVRATTDPYERFVRYTPPAPAVGPSAGATRPKRI